MRARPAIAVALLLAACRVDVEGAHCALPGSTSECPDGQACGNDLKCSTRAASCGTSFCKVGATLCDTSARLGACVADADPVCGSWSVQPCGVNLECVGRGAQHACECVANAGTEFATGAGGSPVDGGAHPTGLWMPPECRFKRLGDALAAAVAHGGPATVQVYGYEGTAVVFTGEAFPLVVPPNVSVFGADAPAGETVIHGDAATSASMVVLQGRLERVRLQNVSMTGNGIDATCGNTGMPILRDVIVSAGGQKLAAGVTVRDGCGAHVERVDVAGASGAALDVLVPAGSVVSVVAGSFHDSGTGIVATGGKLSFTPDGLTPANVTHVTDNAGTGIHLTGGTAMDVLLSSVEVARNGGTGIHVESVPTASNLSMFSCDVHSNGTVSPTQYGPLLSKGVAGGVLLNQSALAVFQLHSNRIYGNHGATNGADELAFDSSGNWRLSTADCASANAIGCVADGAFAVRATGGSVDASLMYWFPNPPQVSGNVTGTSNYCDVFSVTCPP